MGFQFDSNPDHITHLKVFELEKLCCPPDTQFGEITRESVLKICQELFAAGYEEGFNSDFRDVV